MTHKQRERLVQIRISSKMGHLPSIEELEFCREMLRKFPDEYPKDEEIFNIVKEMINPLSKD